MSAFGVALASCLPFNTPDDCEHKLIGCEGGGSGPGGGGGTPVGCVPSESADPVGNECGAFVATSGNDAASGTKAEPVRTIAKAIEIAGAKGGRVYACAETFEENVEVPGGVTLFGGLDCANGWAWIGETTRTTVTAPGVIPLRLRGGEGAARVEDVHVVAPSIDAADPSMRGRSSIAAVAEGIAVELSRCVLEAGDAAPGVDGPSFATSAMGGAVGNAGNEACSDNLVDPGLEQLNDCGTPGDNTDDSVGGVGGTGNVNSGGPGANGLPDGAMNGGTGESAGVCTAGTTGDTGVDGTPGAGATGLGTISASGYVGPAAADGTRGLPGQGGGGGGGSKGGTAAGQCVAGSAGGASGGSGGAGGCGGLGGKGGGPAGASIALISLGATLTFDAVTLRSGRGGTGGVGGQGQSGGTPGGGGPGGAVPGGLSNLNPGCLGGNGGPGGTGGRGGGGLGGHSLGIAFQGSAPPTEGLTVETGDAGLGGAGVDPQHDGAPGVKAEVQEIP
ncbi:MAG: PGRS family protein [Polyangiaceae bacterium]|nr:PGRS family protein [Polyangiaceae bacterium]